MKTTKAPKSFDAVNMMRDIRTQISQETANMCFQELQQYIKQQLEASRLRPTPFPSQHQRHAD